MRDIVLGSLLIFVGVLLLVYAFVSQGNAAQHHFSNRKSAPRNLK